MEEPPARNAAWRYGFNVPTNYDDVGLNCGGLSVQKFNEGKCGVCGDSFEGPRYHETGGKYATNIIVRHYISGALIDVKILLSANHKGFMEFRLCSALDSNIEVTQDCLNQHLLNIDGFGTKYLVSEGLDIIFLRVQLPNNLSCSRCVLQWRYHAGNNWGRDSQTGQTCLGCGPQEEFYNCADISIAPKFNHIDSLSTSSLNNPVVYSLSSISNNSTTPMNIIYPFKFFKEFDKTNKTIRCFPTNEALKPLIGIENWCLQLCTINCPPTLCICMTI